MIYEQINVPDQIRALHHSKASATWGSGNRDEEEGRILLSFYSPSHPGGDAVVQYCTDEDWKQAFPAHPSE